MPRPKVTRATATQAAATLTDASRSIRPQVPFLPSPSGAISTTPVFVAPAPPADAEHNAATDARSSDVTSTPSTTDATGTADSPVLDPARLQRLNAYLPNVGNTPEVRALRPIVVNAVIRIADASPESDDSNIGALYAFARHRYSRYGTFVPSEDLTDTNIDEFLRVECAGLEASSQVTYRSTLRRIRRGGTVQTRFPRSKVKPPLTETHWRELRRDAAVGGEYARDAQIILSLTGGAGLIAAEIHAARNAWVTHRFGITVVQVPNTKTGEFREVPVYGQDADRLRNTANAGNPDAFLFRPGYKNRVNASASLKERLSTMFSSWRHYDNNQARHRYIVNLLARGVPFDVVCNIAGIGPGTHLPTDLLFHLPYRDLGEIDELMRRNGTPRTSWSNPS